MQLAYFLLKLFSGGNTFAGQVRKRLAFDRREILNTFLDKVAVRGYGEKVAPGVSLPKIYQVLERPEDLDPALWPKEFVVKPSHGSGAVVIVTESPRAGLSYGVNTETFSWENGAWGMLSSELDMTKIRRLAKHWLESNYEYSTMKFPEWGYRDVPRRVIVEELVVDSLGQPPAEVRFHCFHGRVRFGRITDVLGKEQAQWNLDRDGSPIDVWLGDKNKNNVGELTLPALWDEAVCQAELLSKDMDYLRVDLFITDKQVVLSELTTYPNGGFLDFRPKQFSRELGRLWQTPPGQSR